MQMPSPCFTSGDTKEERRAFSRRRNLRRSLTGRLAVFYDELREPFRFLFMLLIMTPALFSWASGELVMQAFGFTWTGMMLVLFRGRVSARANTVGLVAILLGLIMYVGNIWMQLS